MPNVREIIIGKSWDSPALVLKPLAGRKRFPKAKEIADSPHLAHALMALQGLPDILLAAHVGTTKLMEVQIHGPLAEAAGGEGYRAFAMGENGIVEHATLFEPRVLEGLVNATAGWRIAAAVVGQKYLADIQATLAKIDQCVSGIAQFQRDEQRAKIESAFEYLRQVESALRNGEATAAVRHRLEVIEADMDVVQRHLFKLFETRLDTRIKDGELLGYDGLMRGFAAKLSDLHQLMREHRSAGLTRLCAAQALAFFPGETGLKSARATAIRRAAEQNLAMCSTLQSVISHEIQCLKRPAEAALVKIGKLLSAASKEPIPGLTGTATPWLDSFKAAATLTLAEWDRVESRSAGKLVEACESPTLANTQAPSARFLVEWAAATPIRICKIPTKVTT